MSFSIDRLSVFQIVGRDGKPTQAFQRLWQKMCETIEAQEALQDQAIADIIAAQATATASSRELARINSYTDPGVVLSGKDQAVGASVEIAAHTRVYPVQGSIDVADVVIPAPVSLTLEADGTTGIINATQYSVYYDDTTLADTTPDFKAVKSATNHGDAQPGAAAGRHFVGIVTTPANGAGDTTGTGGAPPGGGADFPIP